MQLYNSFKCLKVIIQNLVFLIGPLTVKDSESGVSTIIGVATDCPYTWEQYRTGPYCTYSRVSAVLPWIQETMKTT